MKNNGRFDRTFANRMMELVRLYRGPHEGSNLFTCLLGLLLVPGEEAWSRVPDEPLSNLRHWGISRRSIKKIGTCPCGNKHPRTLRHLMEILRNAIADHQFDLLHANGKLTGLELKDASGFHAVLRTADLRRLVEKLAEHVGGSRARGDSGDTDFGPPGSVSPSTGARASGSGESVGETAWGSPPAGKRSAPATAPARPAGRSHPHDLNTPDPPPGGPLDPMRRSTAG